MLGACFTQHLWHILRTRALQVSLIESLLQARSNILELGNPKIARQAPILLVAAALSWLVPSATIYPPGALVIRSEPFWSLAQVNASIIDPLVSVRDPGIVPSRASTSLHWVPAALWDPDSSFSDAGSPGLTYTSYQLVHQSCRHLTEADIYRQPGPRLLGLSSMIITNGQISSLIHEIIISKVLELSARMLPPRMKRFAHEIGA